MSISTTRRTFGLAALLGLEVLAVRLIHALGSLEVMRTPGWAPASQWRLWLATSPPEDLLAAGLRLVALACAWWLLGSTMLYLLAAATRLPGLVGAVRWATLPGVRAVVERALAVSLATSLLSAPVAGAQTPIREASRGERVVVVADQSREVLLPPGADVRSMSPTPAGPAGRAAAAAAPQAPPASAPFPPQASEPERTGSVATPRRAPEPASAPAARPLPSAGAAVRVVERGANLWTIARDHLAAATGRRIDEVPNREIHAYWSRLIEANRQALKSGDPNLIYPGEAIVLPPVAGGA